ncbi:hypothetical protein Skr01_15240 [Sphaerisporangium krabiense]|nr:hypothetical protein Skr01_15240 [Sphaerisporangium krabiense]
MRGFALVDVLCVMGWYRVGGTTAPVNDDREAGPPGGGVRCRGARTGASQACPRKPRTTRVPAREPRFPAAFFL